MEQQQISPKKLKALDKVKRANAELAKVVREEKEQLRKTQDRHKYMMGGCVVKYFPEAYDFSEQEMNRIIACAVSLNDVKNMIAMVLKDRPDPAVSNDEEEDENDDYDSDDPEENDPEESDDDEGGESCLFFSERRIMENNEEKYNAGGSFETTIGKTQYEVVMNFKEEGMSMQEKALKIIKKDGGISVQK